jgi:hypothetical protein
VGTFRFRRTRPFAALAAVLVFAAAAMPAASHEVQFFRVAKSGDAWWFIDPGGRRFLSVGVNVVDRGGTRISSTDPAYSALHSYPSMAAWQDDTLNRLAHWGFNTLGAWSDSQLYASDRVPFTVCIQLGSTAGLPWVDMWDPRVDASVDQLAKEMTARWRHSRELIGYFTDNENPWWDETLFAYFMKQPLRQRAGRDGRTGWTVNGTKRVLLDLMDRAYAGDMQRFMRDWRVPKSVRSIADLEGPVEIQRRAGTRPAVIDAFMDALYERYERLVTHALRQADPDHLVLGERYPDYYTARQAAIAGRYNDVLSANLGAWTDDGWVSPNWVASMARLSGRPVLVSEFYFAAEDNTSGNKNTHATGSFPIVRTQRERAAAYAAQVSQMAAMPDVVGWHWFQYYDEPPAGRTDGEDYNMGLVDVENRPYPIASAAGPANAAAVAAHAHAQSMAADASFEFRVPAARPPAIDGVLLDWDKARSWLPAVKGEPLNAPIGDMFVTASPRRLSVAMIYQGMFRDSSFVDEPRSGWPDAECDRFAVMIARPDGERIATVALRRKPEGEGWIVEPGSTKGTVAAGRGGTIELSIPIPDLRELRFAAELRGRADAQVIYWGARPASQPTRPADWGTLLLPQFGANPAARPSSISRRGTP